MPVTFRDCPFAASFLLRRMSSAVSRLLLLAGLLLAAAPVSAQPPSTYEQDGILAELQAKASEAVFGWRFLRRPPALVSGVDATFNGRPVGTPNGYEPFPAEGQSALVSFLVDVGNLGRAAAIGEAEDAVLALTRDLPPHVLNRIGYYDTDYHAFEPHSAAAAEELRDAAAPSDKNSDLSGALVPAIEAAAATPATRRAVFVYTDGHNAGTVPLRDIETLARTNQVSLSFVIVPSMRLADLAALAHLAEATNGKMLTDEQAVRDDVLVFLLSGARVRFPLGPARRYFWEPRAILRVALHFGDRRLELSTDVDVPWAGPMETLSFAWRLGPAIPLIVGAVAGGMIVAGLGVSFRMRRGRKDVAG